MPKTAFKDMVKKYSASKPEASKAEAPKLPAGVHFDEESKTYWFRLSIVDGTGHNVDTERHGFSSAAQAKKAREDLRYELKHKTEEVLGKVDYSKTFEDVFNYYLEHGIDEKRLGTIRKQKVLWKYHVQPKFGDKRLADVSATEIHEYLTQLYHEGDDYHRYKNQAKRGYAYQYVESVLKLFWLIYGQAFNYGWVDRERYYRDFKDKGTKIKMPKEVKAEYEDSDESKISIYSAEEIEKIKNVLAGGNLYAPFMIAYHCGLRVSEIFGLMTKDVDFTEKTIKVRRQLLYDYENRVFYLGPPKTDNGRRTVYMSDELCEYLKDYLKKKQEYSKVLGYKNTEIVYDRNGIGKNEPIQGADFLMRKENGELLSINSVKYWATEVKKKTGISLKFHVLRHTHASFLAHHGVPQKTLMEQLGHASMDVTNKYYVTTDEQGKNILFNSLNNIK